jgi:ADP-ribosylglycohydrolase
LKIQNQEKAIIGCLLGTAVGDAMGLSYEGLSRQRLLKLYPTLNQYHLIFGKGMVSDDTEHTCLVAQSLIASQGDVEIFKSLFAWKLRFWLLGLPAGIGFATLRAIIKLWLGFSADNSGVFSAGNGPAMRCAIIGVCYGHDVEQLRQFVKAATHITHTDPKARFGALAVALAAYLSSLQKTVTPQAYLDNLKDFLKNESADALITLIKKTIDSVVSGQSTAAFAETLGLKKGISGYIYHTVPIVIHVWLRNQNDYQNAVLEIIGCGGDTDTTAAIVGGIIGAQVGKQGIPEQWLENLWEFPRHRKWMEKLGQRLASCQQSPLYRPQTKQNCQACQREKSCHFDQREKSCHFDQREKSCHFDQREKSCHFDQREKSNAVLRFLTPFGMTKAITAIFLRNLIFMIIVLWHGFRRLLPPY